MVSARSCTSFGHFYGLWLLEEKPQNMNSVELLNAAMWIYFGKSAAREDIKVMEWVAMRGRPEHAKMVFLGRARDGSMIAEKLREIAV